MGNATLVNCETFSESGGEHLRSPSLTKFAHFPRVTPNRIIYPFDSQTSDNISVSIRGWLFQSRRKSEPSRMA